MEEKYQLQLTNTEKDLKDMKQSIKGSYKKLKRCSTKNYQEILNQNL